MVAYLMRRHFAVRAEPEGLMLASDVAAADTARPASSVRAFGLASDGLAGSLFSLSARVMPFARTVDLDDDQASFDAAMAAFDELQREIKQAEDQLPLRVLSLHAVAPGLRYASVVPPKPASDDSYVEPLHVIVEFASSSRWPDDIAALHKIKSAFLLRLAEAYAGLHPEARVQIVNRFHGRGAADGLVTGVAPLLLGSQESMDYESDNCLDIWHAASGLTFRLSMLCECEGELLAKKARDLRLAPSLAAHAEAVELAHRRWVRNHVWRPKHHRQILDLCQRHHPAASLAIRLVKRWLSRHMLLGQPAGVSEELAELLAARVFCDVSSSAAGGLAEPAAALSGFVRCLRLLAEWRWSEDLFAVDFAADSRLLQTSDELPAAAAGDGGVWVSSGMSAAVAETLAHAFDVPKRKDCVRVATADDPEAVWWGTVSPVLTRRLRVLAAASLECINGCLAAGSDAQLPQVFTTPLTDYDFVINLCRDVVCRKYEQPPRSAFATTAK
ncbi:U3 snoRNP protein, partial [Coemansia aciculifera]